MFIQITEIAETIICSRARLAYEDVAVARDRGGGIGFGRRAEVALLSVLGERVAHRVPL